MQKEVEAFAEPARRLQEQLRDFEASIALSAKIADLQPPLLAIEQIKLFEPPQQLFDQLKALAGPIPAGRSLPLTLLEDSGDWARNGSGTNVIGIAATAGTLGPT